MESGWMAGWTTALGCRACKRKKKNNNEADVDFRHYLSLLGNKLMCKAENRIDISFIVPIDIPAINSSSFAISVHRMGILSFPPNQTSFDLILFQRVTTDEEHMNII